MVHQTTDFYLNLDRWGALSTVERDRGRWEARLHGPTARLEALRREAVLGAARSVLPVDQRGRSIPDDILMGEKQPENVPAAIVQAWNYARAIQFVHGWYEAFPWTDAGIAQIGRLLQIPTDEASSSGVADLLALQLQAALVGRQSGGVPLLEISAFYGSLRAAIANDSTYSHLYSIALRVILLQKGYIQILFSPIDPAWFGVGRDPAGSESGLVDPEEQLGVWLDAIVELLIQVGRHAEAGWSQSQSLAARSALQEAILAIAHRQGRVTAGDVLRSTGANRNTVKDNLTRLVEQGILNKQGHKRGTIYFLPS